MAAGNGCDKEASLIFVNEDKSHAGTVDLNGKVDEPTAPAPVVPNHSPSEVAGAPSCRGRLKPDRDVQKILISSPCAFAGEFETENLLLAPAWPSIRDRVALGLRVSGAPGREGLMLAFRTDPADQGGIVIPNYDHVGDMVCSYMSLLYGKRFESHGAVESSGFYNLPNLRNWDADQDAVLPQNKTSPRPDFAIPLVLNEVRRLMPLLFGEMAHSDEVRAFRGAAKFYQQALRAAEADLEVAYLHLITAGEILAEAVPVEPDRLLDAQMRELLERIAEGLPDGARVARLIRSKVRSIRRRFVHTLCSLTDEGFFKRTEANEPFARLTSAGYPKALAAAYDLRSQYVHTGQSFGHWIAARGMCTYEVQVGRPVVGSKQLGRVLADAPTYIGLERIIRYALLRFGERFGLDLAPSAPPDASN